MTSLIQSSVQPTTLIQYQKVWKNFSNFHLEVLNKAITLPVECHDVGLYLSHLTTLGLQPNTVQSHLSAISFVHKINNCGDPTQTFLIKKLMTALHRKIPCIDKRRPVSVTLLKLLISDLNFIHTSAYDVAMFSAMYSLAYSACLRVGELAVSNHKDNTIQLSQINEVIINSETTAIRIYFSQYKHSDGDKPILEINAQVNDKLCPVKMLKNYLNLRPSLPGPIFLSSSGKPISRQQFVNALHTSIKFRSLDPSFYNTHSFRIGRCSDMMSNGFSDAQIRAVGRWKSNAYKRYIRPSVISV